MEKVKGMGNGRDFRDKRDGYCARCHCGYQRLHATPEGELLGSCCYLEAVQPKLVFSQELT